MTDNFADTPISIGEIRADKTQDGRNWSPRDAVVDWLRRYDKGEISNCDTVIICYRESNDPKEGYATRFNACAPDPSISLGVLNRVAFLLNV